LTIEQAAFPVPTPRQTVAPKRRGRPCSFDRLAVLERAMDIFWSEGYEPASVSKLCAAMKIKVPSLYAAFGSKARLFLEAVRHYEQRYWGAAWDRLGSEPDAFRAVSGFFLEAARTLSSPESPCGCLVVLGATNVSSTGHELDATLKAMRKQGEERFLKRVRRGIVDEQLSHRTDAVGLAATLNTLLQGMSVQARDGASIAELERIALIVVELMPRASPARMR
jgi:AcrR family transcriptional regulator